MAQRISSNCVIRQVNLTLIPQMPVVAQWPLRSLKLQLWHRTGVPCYRQKILLGQQELENGKTLTDQGVKEGSTLVMVLVMRTGEWNLQWGNQLVGRTRKGTWIKEICENHWIKKSTLRGGMEERSWWKE